MDLNIKDRQKLLSGDDIRELSSKLDNIKLPDSDLIVLGKEKVYFISVSNNSINLNNIRKLIA